MKTKLSIASIYLLLHAPETSNIHKSYRFLRQNPRKYHRNHFAKELNFRKIYNFDKFRAKQTNLTSITRKMVPVRWVVLDKLRYK